MVDEQNNDVDFKIDRSNFYREETFTDLKVGAIKRLTPVKPDGSYRVWENLSHNTPRGTPYWSAKEIDVANESIKPDMVDPSLLIVMNTSPGFPSS